MWLTGCQIPELPNTFCFCHKSPLHSCAYFYFPFYFASCLQSDFFILFLPPPSKSPNSISFLQKYCPSPISVLCRNYCICIFCLRFLGIIDKFAFPWGVVWHSQAVSHLKHQLADRKDCLCFWIRARAKKCSTVLSGTVAHRSISFIILSYLWPTTYRARQKIYIFPLAQEISFLWNKFTHSPRATALQAWKPWFYYVGECISDFPHTENPSGYTTV